MIITDEKLLRVKCTDVLPEEIGSLVEKLEKELKKSEILGNPGIGLAAPQIGIAKNIAIVRLRDGLNLNLVNAKIDKVYNKTLFDNEGCLSFPGRYEKTFRYQEIVVINNLDKPESFICTGLLAVVCQHELDHLVGKLLPDFSIKKNIIKANRNDICPCGSLKKYKKCCGK